MKSSASIQWVFCENCSTCNFDLFVGSGELHIHLFHHLDLLSAIWILLGFSSETMWNALMRDTSVLLMTDYVIWDSVAFSVDPSPFCNTIFCWCPWHHSILVSHFLAPFSAHSRLSYMWLFPRVHGFLSHLLISFRCSLPSYLTTIPLDFIY